MPRKLERCVEKVKRKSHGKYNPWAVCNASIRQPRHRRKGVVIIKRERGILVVKGNQGSYMLPGGGADRGETRRQAAIRELKEETGLSVRQIKEIGKYKGRKFKSFSGRDIINIGKVFKAKATGIPKPMGEIKKVAYWKPGSRIRISPGTRKIIDKYGRRRK